VIIALAYGTSACSPGQARWRRSVSCRSPVAQFAPASSAASLETALSRGGDEPRRGFAVWAYTLLMPALLQASGTTSRSCAKGRSHRLLRPEALFGASRWIRSRRVFWSLSLNLAFYVASRC